MFAQKIVVRSLLLALSVSTAFYVHSQSVVNPQTETSSSVPPLQLFDLAPSPSHHVASRYIYDFVNGYHYLSTNLDDAMSARILDSYIEMLDGNKSYFMAEDIREFQQYRDYLDNSIRTGWLKPSYHIYSVLQKRWIERHEFAIGLLQTEMDFTRNEDFYYDREELPWAASAAELDEYWRKRVKNDALNLKLAGKNWTEIKELLTKRYETTMRRVTQVKSEEVFSSFMNAYTNVVDPHTNYFSPRIAENFDIEMKLSLEGIGAVLQSDDVYTKVNRIVEAGPADKSGEIAVDDKILAVGQDDEPMVDVVGWRLDDVVDLIRGDAGSYVRLEIEPANSSVAGKTKIIKILREQVKLEEQAAKSEIIEIEKDGKKQRVGVIDLPKFYVDFAARYEGKEDYRSTTRDIKKLVEAMKKDGGIDALMIDLRANGGGALDEATSLTGLFIDRGPVVLDRNRDGKVDIHKDTDAGVVWEGPLAVLVNGGSASASEIFAGAIQDYGRGLIIGEQTFGKGTVQRVFDLNNRIRSEDNQFGALKLTINKFYRITGESTQLKGIYPDISFPDPFSRDYFSEQSYDSAMVWDKIEPVKFEPVANLSQYLEPLRLKHQARVSQDLEFQNLVEDIAEMNRQREEKKFSLNIQVRETQREQDKTKQLARENQRRQAQGKKPLVEINEETELTEAKDAKLYETAHILADFVDLQKVEKIALVK